MQAKGAGKVRTEERAKDDTSFQKAAQHRKSFIYSLPSLTTSSADTINPNGLRHKPYVTHFPLTNCARVDLNAFALSGDRQAENRTKFNLSPRKAISCPGINTLFSVFTAKPKNTQSYRQNGSTGYLYAMPCIYVQRISMLKPRK